MQSKNLKKCLCYPRDLTASGHPTGFDFAQDDTRRYCRDIMIALQMIKKPLPKGVDSPVIKNILLREEGDRFSGGGGVAGVIYKLYLSF